MGMSTNLPYYYTEFVGREDDVAVLQRMIPTRRLVTLLGAGGIGKTRLAVEVATRLLPSFTDGVWLVELGTLNEAASVTQLVASTLGVREQSHSSTNSNLIAFAQAKNLLLILDNCEHVVDACTALIASLLTQCPHMHVLVTSRERLGLTGEFLWRVAPLAVPSLSTTSSTSDELLRYEGIQLFLKRAVTVAPRFVLNEQNASAVAQICSRLDGLPLALELAAARVSMFSVEQLAGRLHERFRLLTQGDRTAAERQSTLFAAVDWSYSLLSPIEQRVFRHLSVFVGSWALEALEGICADDAAQGYDLLDVLTRLVDKSLVIAEMVGEEMRYRLLETMQDYAGYRLRETEDARVWHQRHWNWYLQFVEEAARHLQGEQQREWFQRLEHKLDNLRLAMERSLAEGRVDITVRFACALTRFWATRGFFNEGRRWFEVVLAHPQLSKSQRAAVDQQMVEILRYQGEYDRCRELLEERLALLRELDEPSGVAETLSSLGWTAFYQGDFEETWRYSQEGLALFQESNDQAGIANCLSALALAATVQGEYVQALTWLQEIIAIRRKLGDLAVLAHALNAQARAAALGGQRELAHQACWEALTLASTLKQPFGIAYSLEAIATLAMAWHHMPRSVRIFGAADKLRTNIGVPLPPSLRLVRERELLVLRVSLGEESFTDHWMQGQMLSRELAMKEAWQELDAIIATPEPPPTSSGRINSASTSYPAGLSQREVEVLRLVAAGMTDPQVAETLVLSTRTVSTHLRSIYRKLNVTSRQAATRFALEHHLL